MLEMTLSSIYSKLPTTFASWFSWQLESVDKFMFHHQGFGLLSKNRLTNKRYVAGAKSKNFVIPRVISNAVTN